eukprot:TRINITY_DN6761_c0_g1_i12.p1 TRINITY_DN6761_c0_g1~~TRINITY_DN6761_c0_g1_i12.p1  ORF type:complete len:235 (+),score=24.30 TRINITY_DN6761_c0_g1_i12:373-1077(+)
MLQMHHMTVSLVYLVQVGNFQEANKKLDKLHSLVGVISQSEYQSVFYTWMPLANLYAFIYLLSTICHRPLGNVQTAIGFAEKGINLINGLLDKEVPRGGCGPQGSQGGGGGDGWGVTYERAEFIYSLLRLKFLLLENLIYINLTTCKLLPAINQMNDLCMIYDTYPELITDGGCTVNLLLGLYAQAIGSLDYALAHFNSALLRTQDYDRKAVVLIHLALAYLANNSMDHVFQGL